MMYPTTEQIAKLGGDRYLVTIAAAKGARKITEEYVAQREQAEKLIARKETDKSLFALIDPDIRDDKAVKTSIKRLMSGRYAIVMPEPLQKTVAAATEKQDTQSVEAEASED